MTLEASSLPTHLAKVVQRLNVVGPEASADTFLVASYIVEAAVKSLVIAFRAALAGMSRALLRIEQRRQLKTV